MVVDMKINSETIYWQSPSTPPKVSTRKNYIVVIGGINGPLVWSSRYMNGQWECLNNKYGKAGFIKEIFCWAEIPVPQFVLDLF